MTGSRTLRRSTIKQELLRKALHNVDTTIDRSALYDMPATRCRPKARGISILPRFAKSPQLVPIIQRSLSNLNWEPHNSVTLLRSSRQRKKAGSANSIEVTNLCDKCMENDNLSQSRRSSRASSLSYPSSWNLQTAMDEPESDNDLSPSEVTNCDALNRTPYDHRLAEPIIHRDAKICAAIQCSLQPQAKFMKKPPTTGTKPPVEKPKMRSKSIQSNLYNVAKEIPSFPNPTMMSQGADTSGIGEKQRVHSGKADEITSYYCHPKSSSGPSKSKKNNGGYTTSDCSCASNHNGRHKSQEIAEPTRYPTSERFGRIERLSQPPAVLERKSVVSESQQSTESNHDLNSRRTNARNQYGMPTKIEREQCKKNVGFDCSMKNCSCTPNVQSLANLQTTRKAQNSNRGQNVVVTPFPVNNVVVPPVGQCTCCKCLKPIRQQPKPEPPTITCVCNCPSCRKSRAQAAPTSGITSSVNPDIWKAETTPNVDENYDHTERPSLHRRRSSIASMENKRSSVNSQRRSNVIPSMENKRSSVNGQRRATVISSMENKRSSVNSQNSTNITFPNQRTRRSHLTDANVNGVKCEREAITEKYPSPANVGITEFKTRCSKDLDSTEEASMSDCKCANCGASIKKVPGNQRYLRVPNEPAEAEQESKSGDKTSCYESVAEEMPAKNNCKCCKTETCYKQCGKCKITPAKTKEGDAMVNLVVDDNCHVNQIIQILQETVAGLEKQKQLLSQQNQKSKACASETTVKECNNTPENNMTNAHYGNPCSCRIPHYMPCNAFPQQYNQCHQPNAKCPHTYCSTNGARARIVTKTDYDYTLDGPVQGCQQVCVHPSEGPTDANKYQTEPINASSRPRSGGITYSFDECPIVPCRNKKRNTLKTTRSFIQIIDMVMALRENNSRLRKELFNGECEKPRDNSMEQEYQVSQKTKRFLDLPDHNSYERHILEGLAKRRAARQQNDSLAQKPIYVAENEESLEHIESPSKLKKQTEYKIATRRNPKQKPSNLDCECKRVDGKSRSYRQPQEQPKEDLSERSIKHNRSLTRSREQIRRNEPTHHEEIQRKSNRNSDCYCTSRRQIREKPVKEDQSPRHYEQEQNCSSSDFDYREENSLRSWKQTSNEDPALKNSKQNQPELCRYYHNMDDLDTCKRDDSQESSNSESKYSIEICPCQKTADNEKTQKKPSRRIFPSCCKRKYENKTESLNNQRDIEEKTLSAQDSKLSKKSDKETKKSKSRSSIFPCNRSKRQQEDEVVLDAKKRESKSSLPICKWRKPQKNTESNETERNKIKSSRSFTICKRKNREPDLSQQKKSERRSDSSIEIKRNNETNKEVGVFDQSEPRKIKSRNNLFSCNRRNREKNDREDRNHLKSKLSTSKSSLYEYKRQKRDKKVTLQTAETTRSKSRSSKFFSCLHRLRGEKKYPVHRSETNTTNAPQPVPKQKSSGVFPCCKEDKKNKKQSSSPEEECICDDDVKVLYDSSNNFSNHSNWEAYENSNGEEYENSDCDCSSETDMHNEILKPQLNKTTNNLKCTILKCR